MRKIILRSFLSLGDAVVMTAAIRDIHKLHPGEFVTDVRTSCSEVWENNPYITKLDESDPDVQMIDCGYPAINWSNQRPYHFIHGYHQNIAEILKISLYPTEFKGDIHISDEEKSWMSQVQEITGDNKPFWIIVAGGKYDYTAKWWANERYQEVVDHYKDLIRFVQVGELHHNHAPLENVVNLLGKTDVRQLIRLVYHAQGIICPVTSLMHLAAAVPTKPWSAENRPCVVIAGGREPTQWEMYPTHQFIHTIGALPCCASGGCWKARVKQLGDNDEKDLPDNLCKYPIGNLPKCMDMISTNDVIRRIDMYYQGNIISL